jgi:hypothetical protein
MFARGPPLRVASVPFLVGVAGVVEFLGRCGLMFLPVLAVVSASVAAAWLLPGGVVAHFGPARVPMSSSAVFHVVRSGGVGLWLLLVRLVVLGNANYCPQPSDKLLPPSFLRSCRWTA